MMRGKNSVYSILMIFVLLSFLPELCISFENSDDFNRKIVYEKIFSKRNFNTIPNIHNDIKSQDVIITLMSFSSNLYINDTRSSISGARISLLNPESYITNYPAHSPMGAPFIRRAPMSSSSLGNRSILYSPYRDGEKELASSISPVKCGKKLIYH